MTRKLVPRTKKEFAEVIMRDYGYNAKVAKDLAAIAAGHGAFPDEPPTPIERLIAAAVVITEYSHCDSDEDYQEAVAELEDAVKEVQARARDRDSL